MIASPVQSTGPTIALVRRDELPTLRSVAVDGQTHNLGIHKDFRRHPDLAAILPENARLSIAWVRLEHEEQLDVHQHPVATMIVIGHGSGLLRGDRTERLESGDVVAIPPGCRHGFVGGPGGFWALSIQFDGAGLYELARARVHFEGDRSPGLVELLRRNEVFAEVHLQNPIFGLVRDNHLSDPPRRARLLDVVQVWSTTFHRLLLLRGATTGDPKFSALFEEHLAEEFDHAKKLFQDRSALARTTPAEVWDPALDAAANWFLAKMLRLDDAEKAVLVHLVLEVGSKVFHGVTDPILSPYGETDYFEIHDEADDRHEGMCVPELDGLDERTYERLFLVQKQGWDMLEAMCARMTELVLSSS